MTGIVVIDKPSGYTSFDVVAVAKSLFKQKKIGHAGTLDPLATGVLPVLLGRATKAQAIFPDSDKEYIASFKLGLTTDTEDITGKILTQGDCSGITCKGINQVLPRFTGNIMQTPPMYSALSKNGVKLYKLARNGIVINREARSIFVHELRLMSFDDVTKTGVLQVRCSTGTYVRTLCQDIGEALGCGATMTALRRTRACSFSIEQSITLDMARELAASGEIEKCVLPVDSLFSCYGAVHVTVAQGCRFCNGGSLAIERLTLPYDVGDREFVRVYNIEKLFIGLGILMKDTEELKVFKLFNAE